MTCRFAPAPAPTLALVLLAVVMLPAAGHGQSSPYTVQPVVTMVPAPASPTLVTAIAPGWSSNLTTIPATPTPPSLVDANSRLAQLIAINPSFGSTPVVQPNIPPVVQPVMATLPAPVMPGAVTAQGVYLVKKGAHLSSVARRTSTMLDDLIKLNPRLCPDDLLPAGTAVLLPIPGQY